MYYIVTAKQTCYVVGWYEYSKNDDTIMPKEKKRTDFSYVC